MVATASKAVIVRESSLPSTSGRERARWSPGSCPSTCIADTSATNKGQCSPPGSPRSWRLKPRSGALGISVNLGPPLNGLDPGPSGDGRSAAQAAKLLNVSRDATNKAAKIAKDGANELVQAVTDGKVSLDAAAQVANLPKAKQREAVAKGKVQEAAKKSERRKLHQKGSRRKHQNLSLMPTRTNHKVSFRRPMTRWSQRLTRNHRRWR